MLRSTKNSNRQRTFGIWRIFPKFSTKEGIPVYCLSGILVEDSEPDWDRRNIRTTTTSPIVSCTGNVVTTASGSKYTLTVPIQGQTDPDDLPFNLQGNWIPEKFWNKWIKDDNWLTA